MLLYVFEGFELQGVETEYSSLRWTRKFNDAGNFEITMPFTKERLSLFSKGRIVYKKNTDEAAFVQDRNIYTDGRGREHLVIRGAFLAEMLSRRIATYTASASPVTAIEAMVLQNMIAAGNKNRNIPGLVLDACGMSMPQEAVKVENREILEAAVELCAGENIGFRVLFDHRNQAYRFRLYAGRQCTDVVFSQQYGNVLEQEYYAETSEEKTTALVDSNGSIAVTGDEYVGLDRKEAYAAFRSSEGGSPQSQGNLFLKEYREKESMDTVIDNNSRQFVYLEDWDLGDIVSCKNSRWDVVIQKNILEIEEYYDQAGRHLTVIFGDYIHAQNVKGR